MVPFIPKKKADLLAAIGKKKGPAPPKVKSNVKLTGGVTKAGVQTPKRPPVRAARPMIGRRTTSRPRRGR